ncbi:MAG: hypothetical protein ACE3JK_17925 [Sporolactobacillus sp.]
MREVKKNHFVWGFTTNPSLMKQAGITDYLTFAKQVVAKLLPAKASSSLAIN